MGDRYYGGACALPADLSAAACSFVLRLRQKAVWTVVEEFRSAADQAAGVIFDGMVRLGERPAHPPVRLVRVITQGDDLLLVSSGTRSGKTGRSVILRRPAGAGVPRWLDDAAGAARRARAVGGTLPFNRESLAGEYVGLRPCPEKRGLIRVFS